MKRIIYILLFLCLIFNTNNYQELNKMAIITNIGIEKENHNYSIIYQEVIPNKENGRIINNYKYYISKDRNIKKAFLKMKKIIPKKIYYGHLENVLLKDIEDKYIFSLDRFINKDIDNYKLIITNDSLKKIFNYGDYKYINTIIKKNISYQEIKKNNLEQTVSYIPIIKFNHKVLMFYKYKKVINND